MSTEHTRILRRKEGKKGEVFRVEKDVEVRRVNN